MRYSVFMGHARDPTNLPSLRLTPRQMRARLTLDHICEAAARLLEMGGASGLTTNHVAARAGYSIGTLYRWFPNKQALLALLAQREAAHLQARVALALAAAPPAMGIEDLVRIVIGAALQPFEGRPLLRRALLALLPAASLTAIAGTALDHVLPQLEGAAKQAGLSLSATGRLALPHAPPGAIAAAILREPALLDDPEFETAMVQLVAGFFAPAPGELLGKGESTDGVRPVTNGPSHVFARL